MNHVYEVEVTDTFGGTPNYSWVCRKRISVACTTQRAVVRAAKKALSYANIRGVVEDNNDTITFRPFGLNVIMFITLIE